MSALGPGRDRWRARSLPAMSTARISGARFSARDLPARVGVSGKVISSGAMAATCGRAGAGTAAVTSPAPAAQRGKRSHGGRTGPSPAEPRTADDQDVAEVAFVRVGGRGDCSERERGAGPVEIRAAETMAASGEPMGATTTGWSQRRVNCAEDMRRLGRGEGDDRVGGKNRAVERMRSVKSAGQPEGRSTARIGARAALIQSSAASGRPLSGGLKPVPTIASTMRSVSRAAL